MAKKKTNNNAKKNTASEVDDGWTQVAQMASQNEKREEVKKQEKQAPVASSQEPLFTDQQIRHLLSTLSARLMKEEKEELQKIEQQTQTSLSDLKNEILNKINSNSSDVVKQVDGVMEKHFQSTLKQNTDLKRENAILTLRLQTSEVRGTECK